MSVLKWVPHSLVFFRCRQAEALALVWSPADFASAPLRSGANDAVLRLWDGRSGTCERTWSGHTDAILDFCLSSDGQSVCTCSEDGTARVFGRQN